MKRTRLAGAFLVAGLTMLAGCQQQEIGEPPLLPPERPARGSVPSYRELAGRYNANIAGLDQLWSRSVTSVRWVDEEGDRQFEQGEGNFIFVQPGRVALTVGKLGETLLWGGSNEQLYWLFDMTGEPEYASVGRHEYVGRPCARELPLPVNPRQVPYLLGILPLELERQAEVEVVRGYYVLEFPEDRLRLVLDPDTALPVRVDLTDERGYSIVVSRLYDFDSVDMLGLPPGQGPMVPTRAEFYVPGEEAQMKLFLSSLTDGRERGRINPRAFDFDALLQALEPDELVWLDEGCEEESVNDE